MTSRPWCEDSTAALVLHDRVDGRLVVGGLLVLGSLAVIPVTTLVTGDNPTTSEPGDRSRVAYLDAGDCFHAGPTFDEEAEETEVTVLDCAEPHDSEVVWSDSFSTYGSEGEDAISEAREEAEDECRDRFEEYAAQHDGVRPRWYLGGGTHRMRDLGTDGRKWEVACVAWRP